MRLLKVKTWQQFVMEVSAQSRESLEPPIPERRVGPQGVVCGT